MEEVKHGSNNTEVLKEVEEGEIMETWADITPGKGREVEVKIFNLVK